MSSEKRKELQMSKPKHTPGPWKVRVGSKHDLRIEGKAGHICSVELLEEGFGQRDADAERIVACVNACEGIADPSVVPELLGWLKAVERQLSYEVKAGFINEGSGAGGMLPKMREIIARAEGRSK
jgi:hypothetical protein